MALTDTAIRNAKAKEKPYKVADSQGLYLLVNPRGSKLWRVKYRINGAERKLALGAYPEITLAEARTARDAAHRQLAHAVDPNVAKRQAPIEASMREGNCFASIAEELIAKREQEGVSAKDGVVAISASQMGCLLDGIDWRHPGKTWRPMVVG